MKKTILVLVLFNVLMGRGREGEGAKG